jgi:hypothetical protein
VTTKRFAHDGTWDDIVSEISPSAPTQGTDDDVVPADVFGSSDRGNGSAGLDADDADFIPADIFGPAAPALAPEPELEPEPSVELEATPPPVPVASQQPDPEPVVAAVAPTPPAPDQVDFIDELKRLGIDTSFIHRLD